VLRRNGHASDDQLLEGAERARLLPFPEIPDEPKKNGMTNRKIEYWVIPPEADREFVAHMEEVLETYAKAYDPSERDRRSVARSAT
jgi:hypothetical protein